IHEAKYLNDGSRPVTFGFTTEDEMMIIYIQYVDGTYQIPQQPILPPECISDPWEDPCLISSVNYTPGFESLDVKVFPNPFSNEFTVGYTLDENSDVSLEVINLLGQQVESVFDNVNQGAGEYNIGVNSSKLTEGIYLVKLTVNGESMTTKVVAE
ncbi:MAG: T9SS type A sorting domain-containing protein, partial [Cytophagales bacterium]|nr:T9SS type A sorting domain-containing protein [Cytophagales bacterium]